MSDLKGLINRLVEYDVDFVVVGGFAAVAHGSPLMTMDVDICCRMSSDNLMKLQKALSDLHPVHRITTDRRVLELTERQCRGLKNLYLDTDWGQLDCLGEVKGIGSFDVVKRESIEIEIDSGTCRILGLDALIRAKKAMGRPRDIQTVEYLTRISHRIS